MLCACKNWRSSVQVTVLTLGAWRLILPASTDRVAISIRADAPQWATALIPSDENAWVQLFVYPAASALEAAAAPSQIPLTSISHPLELVGSLARQSWYGFGTRAFQTVQVFEYFEPFPQK